MSPHLSRHRRNSPFFRAVAGATVVLILGCDLPHDPEGTLNRARHGTLRVGVSTHEPWVQWDSREGRRPTGIEAELIEEFATRLDADVHWVRGSETQLLTALEEFRLDVVIGGLTEDTLWSDRVALSRPYAETGDEKRVIAVPPGENGFLLRLDRFLKSRDAEIKQRLREMPAELEVANP